MEHGRLFLTLRDCSVKHADTHYWKATSQVACLVAAVVPRGASGELRAAALEVFRGCLNVDISCKPVLSILYTGSNHMARSVNFPIKAQNVKGGGLFGSSAPAAPTTGGAVDVKQAMLQANKY